MAAKTQVGRPKHTTTFQDFKSKEMDHELHSQPLHSHVNDSELSDEILDAINYPQEKKTSNPQDILAALNGGEYVGRTDDVSDLNDQNVELLTAINLKSDILQNALDLNDAVLDLPIIQEALDNDELEEE